MSGKCARLISVGGCIVGLVRTGPVGLAGQAGSENAGRVALGRVAPPAAAEAAEATEARVKLSLVSESLDVKGGEEFTIAAEFDVREAWHIYGGFVNDTGMEPRLEWELPAGWSVVRTDWPVPERHTSEGGILDHVYEGKVVALVTMRAAKNFGSGGSAAIGVAASWLVCKDVCVAEEGTARIEVRGGKTTVADASRHEFFAGARAKLAQQCTGADGVTIRVDGGVVAIEAKGAEWMAFYPDAVVEADEEIAAGDERRKAMDGGNRGKEDRGCLGMEFVDLFGEAEKAGEKLEIRIDRTAGSQYRVSGIVEFRRRGGAGSSFCRVTIAGRSGE